MSARHAHLRCLSVFQVPVIPSLTQIVLPLGRRGCLSAPLPPMIGWCWTDAKAPNMPQSWRPAECGTGYRSQRHPCIWLPGRPHTTSHIWALVWSCSSWVRSITSGIPELALFRWSSHEPSWGKVDPGQTRAGPGPDPDRIQARLVRTRPDHCYYHDHHQ